MGSWGEPVPETQESKTDQKAHPGLSSLSIMSARSYFVSQQRKEGTEQLSEFRYQSFAQHPSSIFLVFQYRPHSVAQASLKPMTT